MHFHRHRVTSCFPTLLHFFFFFFWNMLGEKGSSQIWSCSYPLSSSVYQYKYLWRELFGKRLRQSFQAIIPQWREEALLWKNNTATWFWLTTANTLVTESDPHKLTAHWMTKAQHSPATFSVETFCSHKWAFLSPQRVFFFFDAANLALYRFSGSLDH